MTSGPTNRVISALCDEAERLFRSHDIDAGPAEIAEALTAWPQHMWAKMAVCCGLQPPTEATQIAVVARFVARAELVAMDRLSQMRRTG